MSNFVSTVPSFYREMIEDMIELDEGGWVFTNYSNDPGGMTYGGMTYKTFSEHMQTKYQELASSESFKIEAEGHSIMLRERVRQVYYDVFLEPVLQDFSGNLWNIPAVLSACVNVSAKGFVRIIQMAINEIIETTNFDEVDSINSLAVDGLIGKRTRKAIHWVNGLPSVFKHIVVPAFKKAWTKYYADLVQGNADAWEQYLIDLEFLLIDPKEITKEELEKVAKSKPKYKRWKYLEGWMNRVNNY